MYNFNEVQLIESTNGILEWITARFLFAFFLIVIIYIIALWKIFTKAGEKGWKSIIPVYNLVILYKISGISPWFVLGYLALIVPYIGGLIFLGIKIYQAYNLSRAFGKAADFTVGLILLAPIFYMILGFGKATYIAKTTIQE